MFNKVLKVDQLNAVVRAIHEELQVFHIRKSSKIRLGNANDGGYVALNTPELKAAPQLISFGVGNDISFERGFILNSEVNSEVQIYDIVQPTITLPENIKFQIGDALQLRRFPAKNNSVLKMDVEGSEWVALSLAFDSNRLFSFCQILVEFHFLHTEAPKGLSPYFESVYDKHVDQINFLSFSYYLRILKKLNTCFTLYHIHANNSLPAIRVGNLSMAPLLECSFIRTDLIRRRVPSEEKFPTEYDAPNKLDRPDYSNIQPPEKLC